VTTVFTIGTSNHPWEAFERLLIQADIKAVADVRSIPTSRLPHFNRTTLNAHLNVSGIAYVFLGTELGGRPKDGGVAGYEQMAATAVFAQGIEQVKQLAASTRLALMCAEHEPLTCHRCLLVGRHLTERGVRVAHILRDGTIEPNAATEDRLLALTRHADDDLLTSREDRLAAAYRAQALKITRKTR
jgi:uncharacterized protein (DUF488 family)